MDIKEVVGHLVKKYGTNDPFIIAEAMGIDILYENLGKVLGFYSKIHRIQMIHINQTSSETLMLFTCAHELGHAIQHPDQNTSFLKSQTYYSTDKIEQEANEFAIELLLSKEAVNPITVYEAIESYGIPMQLLYKKFYA